MSWQAMGLNLARPVDPRVVDPWCTPRVTANMFPQHSGRAVVLIGKVLEIRSIDAATTGVYILCPVSGVEFMAQLHPDKLNELGVMDEFFLRLGSDGPHIIISFGMVTDDFDFTVYTGLVDLIWSHASPIFI